MYNYITKAPEALNANNGEIVDKEASGKAYDLFAVAVILWELWFKQVLKCDVSVHVNNH